MAEPTRCCNVCWQRAPKRTLTRWVRQDGEWVRDAAQRLGGRGAYSCSEVCEHKLMKRTKA